MVGSLILTLLSLIAGGHSKVPAIIVFGDSTVDPGNNNAVPTILRSNFPPYGKDFANGQPTGRFSNGRIATDFISERFGLKPLVPAYLDPSCTIEDFSTGVSFASAGTGYDNATSRVLNVIPLWGEVALFVDFKTRLRGFCGDEDAESIVNEALYVISMGTNDFMENYFAVTTRKLEFTVEQYEDYLVNIALEFLTDLHRLGARKVALSGLPPMGCLPLERTFNLLTPRSCIRAFNDVALRFNSKLGAMVSKLEKALVGFRIVFNNVIYDTVKRAVEVPGSYGFEEASLACCGTGTFEVSFLCDKHTFTCPDASKYVFWDAFHPTERTNQIIVDNVMPSLLATFH